MDIKRKRHFVIGVSIASLVLLGTFLYFQEGMQAGDSFGPASEDYETAPLPDIDVEDENSTIEETLKDKQPEDYVFVTIEVYEDDFSESTESGLNEIEDVNVVTIRDRGDHRIIRLRIKVETLNNNLEKIRDISNAHNTFVEPEETLDLDTANEDVGASHIKSISDLTGDGVTVAVIDTGVNRDHEDLQNVVAHIDMAENPESGPGYDQGDHGTKSAGVIGGSGSVGEEGIAPGVEIVNIRVSAKVHDASGYDIDEWEYCYPADEEDDHDWDCGRGSFALDWLEDGGIEEYDIDLISRSMSGTCGLADDVGDYYPWTRQASDIVNNYNVPIVNSAGNHFDEDYYSGYVRNYGCHPDIISVASISPGDNNLADFSNRGNPDRPDYHGPDIAAPSHGPSDSIIDPRPIKLQDVPASGDSTSLSDYGGTSGAAPVITGGIAMMMENNPSLKSDADRVKGLIESRAEPLPYDTHQAGAGMLDLEAILDPSDPEDPEAVINIDDNNPELEQEIELDGSDSIVGDAPITEYQWFLDDGTEKTGETITHSYDALGEYTVQLTVKDNNGNSDTATAIVAVELSEEDGPTAVMDIDPEEASTGDEISFDASDSEPGLFDIDNYEWQLDDTTVDTGEQTTHSFEEEGVHEVILRVEDEEGFTDTAIGEVDIEEDEEADPPSDADYTVNYDGSPVTISVDCEECSSHYLEVKACGDSAKLYDNVWEHEYAKIVHVPINPDIGYGGDLKCTPGTHDLLLYEDGNFIGDIGELAVNYDTRASTWRMDRFDADSPISAEDGLHIHRLEESFSGEIHFREGNCADGWQDSDCNVAHPVQTGVVISESGSAPKYATNINDALKEGHQYPACGGIFETKSACQVAHQEFTSYKSNCQGRCPIGHKQNGESSDYLLRGEMIAGKEFDPQDDFWPTPIGLPRDETNFHICETDSLNNEEGKHVFSPGEHWDTDYFVCEGGNWEPAEGCPPGYTFVGGECERDLTEMEVKFYELSGIEDMSNEFEVGFHIEREEADKFYEVYGDHLTAINARCWHGAEPERPESDDDMGESVALSSQILTGDEAQVTVSVPSRIDQDIEIDRYSCMFTLENHLIGEEGVHLGSNDPCVEEDCKEPLIHVETDEVENSVDNLGDIIHPGYPWSEYGAYTGQDPDGKSFNHHPLRDYNRQY